MNTIIINSVKFCVFDETAITPHVRLISCYPAPDNMVQRVLNREFPNVWLNPSVRCGSEFYGFLCTEEDYKIVKKQQQDAQKAKLLLKEWDGESYENYHKIQKRIEKSYKDWWD